MKTLLVLPSLVLFCGSVYAAAPAVAAKPAAAAKLADAASADATAHLVHLQKMNPNLSRILKENPGVGKYLERMAAQGAVFDGKLPDGHAPTPVSWTIWNHSEATNGTYGHGMKDDTILNKDVVVVWQKGEGKGKVDLGQAQAPGQIVGLYQLRDLVRSGRWFDGGFAGEMRVEGAGKKGAKDVMAFAVVGINGQGRVLGGGLPDMAGGAPVPYQKLMAEKRRASGHQYEGRASEVTHGTQNHVPLADGDTWAAH